MGRNGKNGLEWRTVVGMEQLPGESVGKGESGWAGEKVGGNG